MPHVLLPSVGQDRRVFFDPEKTLKLNHIRIFEGRDQQRLEATPGFHLQGNGMILASSYQEGRGL
jgi:hypothetical protein